MSQIWSLWLLLILFISQGSTVALLDAELASLRQSHRIVQVDAGPKPHAAIAVSSALAKHRIPVPTHVARAAAAAPTQLRTHVSSTNVQHDRGWLTNVTINKRVYPMNFDTGSSDTWVHSLLLPEDRRVNRTTYMFGGHMAQYMGWDLTMPNDQTIEGLIYFENVTVGSVTASTMAIQAATSMSPGMPTMAPVLGLGFPEANGCKFYQCKMLMDHLVPQLAEPLFTANLRHDCPGEWDFGFIDHSKYTGQLAKVNLTDDSGGGYWEFDVEAYSFGSGPRNTHKFSAIIDSGTSLIITHPKIVAEYYAQVPEAFYSVTLGHWIFPCRCSTYLPDWNFFMGEMEAHVDGQYRLLKHTVPGAYGTYAELHHPAGWCSGGVQSNYGEGLTVLGDVFMKSQFVVFNYGHQTEGDFDYAEQHNFWGVAHGRSSRTRSAWIGFAKQAGQP